MKGRFLCGLILTSIFTIAGAHAAQPGPAGTEASQTAAVAQRALIDEALASFEVEPEAPARVFFLGFAGYGAERVFAEEIKLAAQRVGERYGSSARSLLLINDRRDLTTHPLATHDNLRYALRQMGQLMNPDADILFLVLSSHGAPNAMIEVSNTGMEPLGLSPQTVDRLTREAGIRLRVVVVSACFSGTFVEPLADAGTVVLTAASSTRTSFGCSDDRHLTYFGEAFFHDALPGAVNLRSAFEATRRGIRRRERAERVEASQPQSFFGAEIERKLGEIDAVRASHRAQTEGTD